MNAKETMLAILINKKGIKWGNDTIKLVILIAVKKVMFLNFRKFMNT